MGDLCRGAALESPIRRHGTLCAAFPLIVIYVDMAPLVPLRGAKARDYNMFSTVPGFRFLASLSRRVPPAVPRAGGGPSASRLRAAPTGLPAWSPSLCAVTRVRPARARRGGPGTPARPTGPGRVRPVPLDAPGRGSPGTARCIVPARLPESPDGFAN